MEKYLIYIALFYICHCLFIISSYTKKKSILEFLNSKMSIRLQSAITIVTTTLFCYGVYLALQSNARLNWLLTGTMVCYFATVILGVFDKNRDIMLYSQSNSIGIVRQVTSIDTTSLILMSIEGFLVISAFCI